MQFYIGTYKKYNNGDISGAWFDLADYADFDDFMDAVKAAHGDESDPELMVQDCDDAPSDLSIYFKERIPTKHEFEALQKAIEDDNLEAFGHYVGWIGGPVDSDLYASFEDAYCGEHKSERDFAESEVEALGYLDQMPENLRFYFDYEKYASDIFINDYVYCDGHVFRAY
jgi:antirestriction protein